MCVCFSLGIYWSIFLVVCQNRMYFRTGRMRTYRAGWWKSEFIITHTSCMVVLCWNIRPIVLNFCSGFKIQIYGLWTNHWNNGCIHRYQNIYSKKVLILMESTDFETTRNAMSWFVYIFFSMRKNVSRPKYVMSKLIQRNIPTYLDFYQ